MKVTLTDEQWQKILPFLKTSPNIYIGQENECRQFLARRFMDCPLRRTVAIIAFGLRQLEHCL